MIRTLEENFNIITISQKLSEIPTDSFNLSKLSSQFLVQISAAPSTVTPQQAQMLIQSIYCCLHYAPVAHHSRQSESTRRIGVYDKEKIRSSPPPVLECFILDFVDFQREKYSTCFHHVFVHMPCLEMVALLISRLPIQYLNMLNQYH